MPKARHFSPLCISPVLHFSCQNTFWKIPTSAFLQKKRSASLCYLWEPRSCHSPGWGATEAPSLRRVSSPPVPDPSPVPPTLHKAQHSILMTSDCPKGPSMSERASESCQVLRHTETPMTHRHQSPALPHTTAETSAFPLGREAPEAIGSRSPCHKTGDFLLWFDCTQCHRAPENGTDMRQVTHSMGHPCDRAAHREQQLKA